MPELPEVETIVRELSESHLIGTRIIQTEVFWPHTIATPDIETFVNKITNQSIADIGRRGKYIVLTLSEDTLLIHLRMTGKLSISKLKKRKSSHERVQLLLDDGRVLHYEDQRKFGKWSLISSPEDILGKLGLEPASIEFTLKAFNKKLGKRSQMIKPFLLNQNHIAGLGNIYVDEALWEAKIHPKRKVNSISSTEKAALHKAISHVISEGIAHTGTTLGSMQANYFSVSGRRGEHQHHLKVFRREGLPCPRCQTEIIKITVAQRGTHVCPHCQK